MGKRLNESGHRKNRYAKMPLFWRAFGYFVYRYIIKLGFLDGKEDSSGTSCKVGGTVLWWMLRSLK